MIAFHIAHLLGEEIAGLTYTPNNSGGNVFVDWMPDTPDLAVAVMHSGGLPQMTRESDDRPTIQIIGRGAHHDPQTILPVLGLIYAAWNCRDGFELAGALDADGEPIPPVWVTGCTAAQSAPIPIGRDPLGRPEYTLNFSLFTNNPTTHRS